MKGICIIGILLISFGLKAQKLMIYVTEVIDASGFDSTITHLINNSSVEQTLRSVNSYYELDLTKKTFRFFDENELHSEGEITFQRNDEIIQINFVNVGVINGLIIDPKIYNEQVVWFGIYGDYKEICKFNKFEIIKAM